MTDADTITDLHGSTHLDVLAYRYSAPDDPDILEIRDDGIPLSPDDPPAVLLRIDHGGSIPSYVELTPSAAVDLARELLIVANLVHEETRAAMEADA